MKYATILLIILLTLTACGQNKAAKIMEQTHKTDTNIPPEGSPYTLTGVIVKKPMLDKQNQATKKSNYFLFSNNPCIPCVFF